ncbi:MAG: SDR family NAD(P)-dependent oxidoreductase [bacterium]
MERSLQNQVVLITGAGGGLGRCHALYLAALGAKLVVNDLGTAVDGGGSGTSPAEETVAAIRRAGGEAVADGHGVETMAGAAAMVEAALRAFGGLHAVVNNAGILRDRSFAKQSEEDWERVLQVHLTGSRNVCQAAWPILAKQNYGRIVLTLSASGLYGNFGQSNYAAAKAGLLGLMLSLKEEGLRHGIKVNGIAPMARSRMTEGLLPRELLERLDPRFVSPVVAYLVGAGCAVNGQCWTVGAGRVARAAVVEGEGFRFPEAPGFSPEDIAAHLSEIVALDQAEPLENLRAAALRLLKNTSRKLRNGDS